MRELMKTEHSNLHKNSTVLRILLLIFAKLGLTHQAEVPLRHVLRAMWNIRFRIMVIAMICASTFGILAGAYSAIDSLFLTVNRIQSQANMADLELLFAPDDVKNLPDFKSLQGVEKAQPRIIMMGQSAVNQQSVSSLLIGAKPEQFQDVNRLKLLQGELPSNATPQSVALERNCAEFHHLALGQAFNLRVGYQDYALLVGGIVESPEYLIAPLNPSVYVPTNGSLCVMFAAQKLVHDQLGFAAVNSVLINTSSNADDLKASVLNLAHTRLSVDYALTRHEQFSQKFLELDLNTFKVFLPTVVLIFAISSIVVVFFLMYQWIKEERMQIAMLLTLGYSHRTLFMVYALPGVLIVLASIVLGIGLAGFDMWAFGANYAKAIGMPEPTLVLHTQYVLLAIVISILTVVIGMGLPLRSMFNITPMDALRDGATEDSQTPTAWMTFIQKCGGPFFWQYALRNLVRSWRVSVISVFAVSASLAVTISFYVSLTSMERTAIGSIEKDNWHAVVDFDAPLWVDELPKLKAAIPQSQWSTFVKGGAQVESNGRMDNAYLLGVKPSDAVRNVNLMEGRTLEDSDEEAVILERRLAVDHKAKVGESIIMRVRGESFPAKVVGIHSSAVPGEMIVPKAFAQRMLSLDSQFTGAFLVNPAPTTEHMDALHAVRGVVRVTHKTDIIDAILSISGHIWIIIHLSAFMSIGVSALFVLTSVTFTIMSRSGEYGMLRIIGHHDRRISAIVLSEAALMSVCSAILAIPAGWLIGDVLNHQLTDVWFKVNTQPAISDFAWVLVPALVLVPISAWPALRTVLKIPAVDIIKARRFG